ncbi:unnamed protein product [Polarella glacialis]|uniref:Uncharacterized protein n=1 Tax=Polarella glacialis TaxID=89957 RepID=A0A813HBP0_POLGL|nr:unnamed protein product [Polarella glacialis]
MVLPMGGLAPPISNGAPPEEALRLLPWLRFAMFGVTIAVAAEFVAGYNQQAFSDLLTLLVGILCVMDVRQLGQCICCLMLMSCFNGISDLLTLVLILSGVHSQPYPPAAKYFFALECPDAKNVCSWKTVTGDSAIVLAVIVEFVCFRLSARILKAYQQQSATDMGLLDDLGGNRAGQGGYAGGMAGPAPTAVAPAAAAGGRGFTPFSGQGQRLEG